MKLLIAIFLILLPLSPLPAQPEVVAAFPSTHGELLGFQLSESYGVFFWEKFPNVLGVDLRTGSVDTISTQLGFDRIDQIDHHTFAFSNVYDPATRQWESVRLHLFDDAGRIEVVDSVQVRDDDGNWYYGRKTTTTTDRLYFNSRAPDYQYLIWESDGRAAGTRVVASFSQPITLLHSLQDRVLVLTASDAGSGMRAYRLNPDHSVDSLGFLPFHSPRVIGEYESDVYLSGVDSSSTAKIWRIDITGEVSELFLSGYGADHIGFYDQKFRLTSQYNQRFWVGDRDHPQALTEVELAAQYRQGWRSSSRGLAHPAYYLSGTGLTGLEVSRINANDSLEISVDFAPAAASGYPLIGMFGGPLLSARDASGDLILPLTNRQDAYFYLYRVSDQGYESLVRLDPAYRLIRLAFRDGFLYWEEQAKKGEAYRLMRMNLDGPHDQQPLEAGDPEVWYRETAVSSEGFFNQNVNATVEPVSIQVGAEGEVYASFKTLSWMGPEVSRLGIHSHSSRIDTLKGLEIVAKYDPFGNLLWWKSLGSRHPYAHSGHRMCIDPAGDVVLYAGYYQKAYFDSDSLVSSENGNFLAKLDGETGEVRWFRDVAAPEYGQKLGLGGNLQTDAAGNIYVPFCYFGFGLTLDQASLWSDRSPVDAVASYNPDGTLRWAHAFPTPWTNSRTAKQVFAYDSLHQRLLFAQSQGAYNVWSSCEWQPNGYFLQTIDLAGNLLDTLLVAGSDLGGLMAGTVNPEGDFMGFGYHRGTLRLGPFETTSHRPQNGCNQYEGFGFRRNGATGNIVSLHTASTPAFLPFDAVASGDYVYVIGSRDSSRWVEELQLFKFTTRMEPVGYLPLGQRPATFDHHNQFKLSASEGFLYLAGTHFDQHVATGASRHIGQVFPLSVLKIRDEGWLPMDDAFAESILLEDPGDSFARAFPNPITGDAINVMFGPELRSYTGYQLLDLQGRRLAVGPLDGEAVQRIMLPPALSPGYYLLRFFGPGKSQGIKLLKE